MVPTAYAKCPVLHDLVIENLNDHYNQSPFKDVQWFNGTILFPPHLSPPSFTHTRLTEAVLTIKHRSLDNILIALQEVMSLNSM